MAILPDEILSLILSKLAEEIMHKLRFPDYMSQEDCDMCQGDRLMCYKCREKHRCIFLFYLGAGRGRRNAYTYNILRSVPYTWGPESAETYANHMVFCREWQRARKLYNAIGNSSTVLRELAQHSWEREVVLPLLRWKVESTRAIAPTSYDYRGPYCACVNALGVAQNERDILSKTWDLFHSKMSGSLPLRAFKPKLQGTIFHDVDGSHHKLHEEVARPAIEINALIAKKRECLHRVWIWSRYKVGKRPEWVD